MQDDYQNNLDFLGLEKNPFSFNNISSLNKNNLSLKNTGNYNSTRNRKKQILNNTRKSFDNLLDNIPQKKLKRFNTQKNVIRINYDNTIPKYSLNLDNDFILAKKNNLYGNKMNNNGQMNIVINNNDIKLNEDFFAKKIKCRFIKGCPQVKNYKIIINKNKNYKPNIYYINGNSNNNLNNNIEKKILDKFNKNNFLIQKKISFDKLKIYDMNLTMPNSKRNEFDEDNLKNLTEKNLNRNIENKNLPKPQKGKIFRNIKFLNQKKSKADNIKNIIQKQYSEIKEKNINKYNQKENDFSLDYATDINDNNYRKSKSGFIHYNFFSEKKGRNRKNNNINEESDKEIDELLEDLDIYIENEDKKNKTFIEKESNLLNESVDLSDLADEIVNNYPEQESEDINKQSTVPSTSNLESDALYDSSNNNLNMNNLNINIPFNSNKVTNTKPTIVNNIYISSAENMNKSNKNKNDINYNLIVFNEYNNTNNNINNNVNNNIYNDNSNIPKLVTKTYKSPFIIGNMKNERNSKDINEIEDSEMNTDLNEFKNINKNIDTINLNLNNSANINMQNKNIYKIEKNPNLSKSYNQINNINQNLNNKIKKNSTNNAKERKFSDSILRDLLSSHKNTPNVNNNNTKMTDKKEFININNNNIEVFNQNNNFDEEELINKNNIILLNDLKNENNYLYKSKDNSKNIINNSINRSSLKRKKGHISFNLDKNIYIKFGKEDLITNSEITDKNGQICEHIEKNMTLYNEELKRIKPKSIIKKFSTNEIKINKEYIYVENLQERQILPDLYDEFEDQDIKSLEKCLEKSVDKM